MSVTAPEAPAPTTTEVANAGAVIVVPETRTITPHDRCGDHVSKALAEATGRKECGSEAFIKAKFAGGFEFFFCARHGREKLPKLKETALEIVDETKFINESPSVSANHDG